MSFPGKLAAGRNDLRSQSINQRKITIRFCPPSLLNKDLFNVKKYCAYLPFYSAVVALLLGGFGCSCDTKESTFELADCNLEITRMEYGDYCDQKLMDFGDMSTEQPNMIAELPKLSYGNAQARIFQLPVTSDTLYLHQYRDFPGEVQTEVFGLSCGDTVRGVLLFREIGKPIVNTYRIGVAGYDKIIVRAVAELADIDEELNIEPTLTYAAFSSAPNGVMAGNKRYALDCQGRPNRLILSPGPNNADVVAAAEELGLPYESCGCDANIVRIDLPDGVELNSLRPKVPPTQNKRDTVTTNYDLPIIVRDTTLNYLVGEIGAANDTAIVANECATFGAGASGTNTTLTRIAIVDSGIGFEFNPLFAKYTDQGNGGCVERGPYGYDYANRDSIPEDEIGHGTNVASVIVSKLQTDGPVLLDHYKFFGGGQGSLFDALCSIHAAIDNGSHIINLSWGFHYPYAPEALTHTLQRARQKGVIIVNSAGNESLNIVGTDSLYYPAAAGVEYPNMLVVGSHTAWNDGSIHTAFFSNYNETGVDLAAYYGTNVQRIDGTSEIAVGTSISAPLVVRKLAEVMSEKETQYKPDATINAFMKYTRTSASLKNDSIRDGRYLPLARPENGCKLEPQ